MDATAESMVMSVWIYYQWVHRRLFYSIVQLSTDMLSGSLWASVCTAVLLLCYKTVCQPAALKRFFIFFAQ